MGYRFDIFDNNVYSDDFWRGRFIHVEIKSTKVSIIMPISSKQGVYFTLETQQIDSNSYMCLQGGTTAIHKISNKTIEHF